MERNRIVKLVFNPLPASPDVDHKISPTCYVFPYTSCRPCCTHPIRLWHLCTNREWTRNGSPSWHYTRAPSVPQPLKYECGPCRRIPRHLHRVSSCPKQRTAEAPGQKKCVSFTLASSFLHRDAWNDLNHLWISLFPYTTVVTIPGMQMHPGPNPYPTNPLLAENNCVECRRVRKRCDRVMPICGRCEAKNIECQEYVSLRRSTRPKTQGSVKKKDGNGVSLSLWRPLFSIVTRGIQIPGPSNSHRADGSVDPQGNEGKH